MRPRGQLDRSLDVLAGGVLSDSRARDRALAPAAAREIDQQLRVPLSGSAGSGWGYVDTALGWELPFIAAPAQRLSEFKTPHFSAGVEMGPTEPEGAFIVVHAAVLDWKTTAEGWVVGATVRFASSAPMLEGESLASFRAIAHLTFQGYGAESEEGEIA